MLCQNDSSFYYTLNTLFFLLQPITCSHFCNIKEISARTVILVQSSQAMASSFSLGNSVVKGLNIITSIIIITVLSYNTGTIVPEFITIIIIICKGNKYYDNVMMIIITTLFLSYY